MMKIKMMVLSLLCAFTALAEGEFKAGFARVDITPPMGVPMPGYFYKRLADKVIDPLVAECVAVSWKGETGFVFAIDNLHIREELIRKANALIEKETGVPASRQFMNCTHTHTGGETQVRKMHAPEDVKLVEQYADTVVRKLLEVAKAAAADLAPAKLSVASGECRGISAIRRYRMKDGSVQTNPAFGDPNIAYALGEADESLQLVRFKRQGAPDIAIVNFGTHPDTVGGCGISADWPAFVRSTFESGIGGGVKCLFLNGAQGDVNHYDRNPSPGRKSMKRLKVREYMGRAVASAAMRIWDICEDVEAGPVKGEVNLMKAPANLPSEDEKKWIALFDAGRKDEIPLGFMEVLTLTSPGSRARRLMNGPEFFEIPVSTLTIGKTLAFAGFPGEPFVSLGTDVKKDSPFRMTMVSCLVNGDCGYLPSTAAFSEGGYEALSSRFAKPNGDLLVKTQLEQLGRLFGEEKKPILKTVAESDVVVENDDFRLVVGADAMVKSLIVKKTGIECVRAGEDIAFVTATQDRPFNNEIKLIHPNKRTTYPANSIKLDGNMLTVGFAHKMYEAKIAVKISKRYIAFELVDLVSDRPKTYDYLRMDIPPVQTLRIIQLPVVNRKNFGDWLNASWDEKAAIGVVGTSPYPDIDHEKRKGYKILSADLVRGQKLRGASAALIAAPGREAFLDAMADIESDYKLPSGVKSRRSKHVNSSIFHTSGRVTPKNIDEVLKYVKKGGFKYMTFGYADIVKEIWSWALCGDYDYREEYPEGEKSLKEMLAKVKAAGITPGLHTMHSHIGLKSRYVTPVADARLNKTRRFTLAEPLPADTNITELTVWEPTADTTMFPDCRVLQFGGELISYESYTTEPPYKFRGIKRGAWKTNVTSHPKGEIGGILDISEFGKPGSCYLDQNTDLQEEVGAKIAKIYNCGFEYIYMDGSEGVNVPFNFHLSNGQYRQWKMLSPEPLMAEGAAKTHFGWHMLSGANAFDCFGPEIFKEMLIKYPLAQAPITWQEMTRCNFGWWGFVLPHQKGYKEWAGHDTIGTQADMWEFGQSVSIAWRCPMTVQMSLNALKEHPRTDDILETMRRWEEYREKNLMTEAQRKEIISDYHQEHHLLVLADGSLKMVQYAQIPVADGKCEVRAFVFETNGARWVVYWDGKGESSLSLPLEAKSIELFDEFAGKPVAFEKGEGKAIIPAGCRRYLKTSLSKDEIKAAFEKAISIDKAAK